MANPSQQSADQHFLSFATSSSRYKAIVPSGTPPTLPEKPYATRACDECRRKKIKCISLDNSGFCKTCRRINQPCTFNTKIKKRGPRKGYITALESRLKRIEGLFNTAIDNGEDDYEGERDNLLTSSQTSSQASSHNSNNSNSSPADLVESLRQQHLTNEGRFISGYSMGYILSNKQYKAALSEKFGIQIQHNKKSDYYCVLKTGTYEDRRKDQINQLVATGQLKPGETISCVNDYIKLIADIDKQTSDYLLKVYFAHIHSLLPVINKTVFLEEYREIRASLPAASLLRAIYGAAARYVTTLPQYSDDKFPIPQNFSEIMFHKLFRYLNGDYAPDLATVQAIVITNNHYSNTTTTWYNGWLMNCVAVRMCQDIGLHRSSEGWDIPQEEKETRRNVWWAVFVLDRWFSAGTGKPLTIFEEDCDESYPSVYVSIENVMDTMTETDKHLPRFPSIDPGVVEKTTDKFIPINEPFVQLIKLSEILGRILQGLYSPRAKKYSAEHGSDSIVAYLNNALSNWRMNLPAFLEISPVSKQKTQDRSLTAMSGLICLSYCTALILLHRPFIEKDSDKKGSQSAISICTNAAVRTIEVCEQMQLHDFLMVSWDFAVYPVFTASFIHIYNCNNDSPIISDAARSNFLRIMKVVDKLCTVTPCADNIAIILRKLVAKSKLFPYDPDFMSCYKTIPSPNIIERKLKHISTFPLAQSPNEQRSDNKNNWMNHLCTLDQAPLDINDQTNNSKENDVNTNEDNSNNEKSFNNQSEIGVLTDQPVYSNFNNTSTIPVGLASSSAEIPVALPDELFDFSEMYSFSNAQVDQTNDLSAMFRYQPDNPFWAVPNSMQPEDWQSFLSSFQK